MVSAGMRARASDWQQLAQLTALLSRLHAHPQASKPFIRTAWQMSSDIHQTTAPLLYPPQVLSLAALLLAALLDCDDGQSSPAYKSSAQRILRVFDLPGGSDVALSNGSATTDVDGRDGVPRRAHGWARTGEWESQFKAYSDDIEGE